MNPVGQRSQKSENKPAVASSFILLLPRHALDHILQTKIDMTTLVQKYDEYTQINEKGSPSVNPSVSRVRRSMRKLYFKKPV